MNLKKNSRNDPFWTRDKIKYISEPQGPVGEVSHLSYQNPEKRKKIGAEKIKQKNFQIWLKTINVQI